MASKDVVAALMFVYEDSSSSDDSSDDELPIVLGLPCIALALERTKKEKVRNYAEEVVPLYTLDDFKRFFRMSRNTFEVICQQLGTFADFVTSPGGRPPVPLDKQLLMFLWHVGCLEPLCRTADRFDVTEFTVLRIRDRICKVILDHFVRRYIVWPTGADQGTVVRAFREKRGFPGVVGAIDSSHIQLKAPQEHPQTYVNRKGYHSVILQAVCREDLRFIDCFAGWPGSCHDSRVLKNSDLWDNGLNLCGPNHLIGDGGFPVRRWLLTPYRDNGHLTAVKRHYNFCLSSTRQVIERAFSLLKGRFRKLQMIDVNTVQRAVKLCIACCCFHNICILENDELGEYFNDDNNNANLPAVQIIENDAEGVVKRDAVAQQLQ